MADCTAEVKDYPRDWMQILHGSTAVTFSTIFTSLAVSKVYPWFSGIYLGRLRRITTPHSPVGGDPRGTFLA